MSHFPVFFFENLRIVSIAILVCVFVTPRVLQMVVKLSKVGWGGVHKSHKKIGKFSSFEGVWEGYRLKVMSLIFPKLS